MQTDARQFDVRDLLDAEVFPHEVLHLRLVETAVSWVVLTGPYAYKIKKPVKFPYLDASTLGRRRELCEEELRLNRRLAPDLYLDVVRIVRDQNRLRVRLDDGPAVEYAVRMQEFEPDQELARRLDRDEVSAQDLAEFAAALAGLHDQAPAAAADDPYGSHELVSRQVLDNFGPLHSHLGANEQLAELERLEQWTLAKLAGLEPLIRSRKANGRVRECHGDLHAHNIVCWRGRWLPFDCLEFDPALRWIDVVNEVAFLYMDLIARGRKDLAFEFLSRYLEACGDYEGLRLLPLFAVYRALVRAKVDVLGGAPQEKVVWRLNTAVELMTPGTPELILMHGVTASGKSWVSEQLVRTRHAVRVRSDVERKRLLGRDPLSRQSFAVGAGSYAPEITEQTYARLLDCARSALEGDCSIIVDATFLEAARRKPFLDLARSLGARFQIVSCHADRATLESRLKSRARAGQDPSEATIEVLDHQLRTAEPPTAEERPFTMYIDTRLQANLEYIK